MYPILAAAGENGDMKWIALAAWRARSELWRNNDIFRTGGIFRCGASMISPRAVSETLRQNKVGEDEAVRCRSVLDRKSVVEGKSVELGGRPIMKTNNRT